MRSLSWTLLLLALPTLPAAARAGEIIASSSARQPIAASADNAIASPAPGAPIQQAAYLAPPRAISSTLPPPPAALEAAPVPALTRVPAASTPQLRPEPSRQPVSAPRDEPASLFAIERIGFAIEPPPLVFPSGPEALAARPSKSASPVVAHPEDVFFDNGEVADSSPYRFYGSIEYLMWWTKDAKVPVLATTSAPNTTDFGRLGQLTTRSLFGGEIEQEMQSGMRFRLGYWFDTDKPVALEGSFFFLCQGKDGANFSSDSSRVLARPFRNANQGIEFSQLVAAPNVSGGSIGIDSPSSLLGYDVNLRCCLCCSETCRGNMNTNLLVGYRYMQLREGLYITEQGLNTPNNGGAPNEFFRLSDRFDTQNSFYGGQIGIDSVWKRDRWSVDARGTLGLGMTHQVVGINGSALFLDPGQVPVRTRGALLALPSNIGRNSKNKFSVLPELSLTLGYQITDNIQATVGYNFLFWSNVVRPGDQIDRNLDVTRIPRFATDNGNGTFDVTQPDGSTVTVRRLNPSPPSVPFKDVSYWAQGISLGLAFKY